MVTGMALVWKADALSKVGSNLGLLKAAVNPEQGSISGRRDRGSLSSRAVLHHIS